MTRYAAELDTATAVLDCCAYASGGCGPCGGPVVAGRGAVGGDAFGRLDRGRRDDRRTGMAIPGCRWRVRVRHWWRSSRSPSSPPRSGSPRMPGSGTSATRSSCAIGSRGCGVAWSRVTSGRGWRGGSRTRPCCCPRRPRRSWTVTSRHVAHKIGPVQLERARRRGDRHVHARPGRGTTAGEGGRPVLHDRAAAISYAGTAAVHGELDLADALDLEQAVAGLAAQLKDLGSEDSLDVRRAAAVGELARNQLALDLVGG